MPRASASTLARYLGEGKESGLLISLNHGNNRDLHFNMLCVQEGEQKPRAPDYYWSNDGCSAHILMISGSKGNMSGVSIP